MDSLAIQKAYRKIIARYIVNERELTSEASQGSTSISITSTRRFNVGDKIALIDQRTMDAEVLLISDIPDQRTLTFSTGLLGTYPVTGNSDTTSVVRKIIGAETGTEAFIQSIYLGDPTVISHYPAITIDMKTRSSEWMTIESTKETYNIDITIYITAADYGSQYEMMHSYVNAIEQALFRSFYPLVDPYFGGTLAEDVSYDDYLIKVTDPDTFTCHGDWLWLESLDYLKFNRINRYLGNGVYELLRKVGQEFSAGDSVISPKRHIFNTLPESTRFGTVMKETMLKAAIIGVTAQEEVWRHSPFVDPLTY